MNNLMTYKGYSGTVEFSDADNVLFGTIAGITDMISYEADNVAELRAAFQEAVDDYLQHCTMVGKEPCRPYSGKFTLRIEPALHARLAVQAKAHGKSLNQYAVDVLATAG